jgi:hypothetical protein
MAIGTPGRRRMSLAMFAVTSHSCRHAWLETLRVGMEAGFDGNAVMVDYGCQLKRLAGRETSSGLVTAALSRACRGTSQSQSMLCRK